MAKLAIVFYSFSGNTKRACQFLKDKLSLQRWDVDMLELKLEKEQGAFLKQCLDAKLKRTPLLSGVNYDVSGYEFIIFASPVWAFTFAPALRTFLNNLKGAENKRVACILTHGSSLGSKKALVELEEILRGKNAHIQFSKSISGYNTKREAYLDKQFNQFFEITNP